MTTQETPSGVISSIPGRIRKCTFCDYDFFLPSRLASILKTGSTEALTQIDLEYLFFAAWSYHIDKFGGTYPAIECDYGAAIQLYDAWLSSDDENLDLWPTVVNLYWPLGADCLTIELLQRYESDPQLYYTQFQIEEEDEVFDLELSSALELTELEIPAIRQSLASSIQQSLNQLDSKMAEVVIQLLMSDGELSSVLPFTFAKS